MKRQLPWAHGPRPMSSQSSFFAPSTRNVPRSAPARENAKKRDESPESLWPKKTSSCFVLAVIPEISARFTLISAPCFEGASQTTHGPWMGGDPPVVESDDAPSSEQPVVARPT